MEQPVISVGILTNNEIKFEFHGDYFVNQTKQIVNGRFKATIQNKVITVETENQILTSADEIIFTPTDFNSATFVLRDVIIGIGFHWEEKEKQSFQGQLKLIKQDDKLHAINIIPVENYLESVICSEMRATSSMELLKAHAIVSRSWLLAQLEKNKELKEKSVNYVTTLQTDEELIKWWDREDHKLFDVCADDHCQRYQGIAKIYTEAAKNAVNDTAGIVITNKGKVCDARFSKCCGGISENFDLVWEPEFKDYLQAVVDWKHTPDEFELDLTNEDAATKWILDTPPAFCNTDDESALSQVLQEYDKNTTPDFYRWEVKYTQEEISQLINKKIDIDFGNIIDLIPVERGKSGRLIKLKIVGTKKTLTIGKELLIRKALSPTHLFSSAFVVFKKYNSDNNVPSEFIIKGAGWGHGVGLCQIGAAMMAEMGYKFDEILYHYFKNIKTEKIY
ncbi:MAG TPA: SpoIID/LytB domain-containing protein [Ignavibacteriales bacterium]|nr:SpoIID/LytB domain-containing protein [Ignavibacteriales bacterium]HOL80450.1 SpoIID/LytB domain-containing protein [Ignavibacteriales bacterium]HOM64901.1 SpoIID/LytB domain-containing protein [Ignavibacteriales bacterium]HPD68056.1 SpoIID/LytB domain-containing protein [Ignavibacteriales bacterium]HPP32639.1 SpoIID/LytB domain-containing protein [Ignavibacteriales bacterium]